MNIEVCIYIHFDIYALYNISSIQRFPFCSPMCFSFIQTVRLIPLIELSNATTFHRSLAGTAGFNPTGGMDNYLSLVSLVGVVR